MRRGAFFWALFIAVAALISLTACTGDTPPQPPTATEVPSPSPSPTSSETVDDIRYIEMMVPHHQLAVDMAKLAQQKATMGQIKGIAADIILTQADEIRRLNLWKAELGGSFATPYPHAAGAHGDMPPMAGMDVDLGALAASPDFDRDFLQAMIPHHEAAIDMSRQALPHLKHVPLRHLAEDIITTQQVEIDRMKTWLDPSGQTEDGPRLLDGFARL